MAEVILERLNKRRAIAQAIALLEEAGYVLYA
jgi:hypothetical protein